MKIKNVAIFASGSGTNAENLVRYFEEDKKITISIILCNNPNGYVLERAKKLGVPSIIFSKENLENGEVLQILKKNKIDFIVLAGFLLKIPKNIIEAYPNKIVNIHPSLLPKYGGKGMYGMNIHNSVFENGDKESGITIHFVNENYDEGDMIFQKNIDISKLNNPGEIAEKIHHLEYEYFPKILDKIFAN